MNQESPKLVIPRLSMALLALLLGLAPYAMQFTPFAGIYTHGAYKAPYETDPLLAQRIGLIAFGLVVPVLAVIDVILAIVRRAGWLSVIAWVEAWFACLVLGWRSFPYWVAGVYAVYSERVPRADMDPKGVVPIKWLGEIWGTTILLLYPVAVVVIPVGLIGSLVLFRRRSGFRALIPGGCAMVSLVFLVWFSPNYVGWFMD